MTDSTDEKPTEVEMVDKAQAWANEDADMEAAADGQDVQAPAQEIPMMEKWGGVRAAAMSYFSRRKQSYDALNKQKKERLKEVALHVVFVCLFSYVALVMRDTSEAHFLVSGLRNEITGAPIPTIYSESKDFWGVGNMGDFWQWTAEVLVDNLYPEDPTQPIAEHKYLDTNFFLQPPTIRQVRIKGEACGISVPKNQRERIIDCYLPFSKSIEETSFTAATDTETAQGPEFTDSNGETRKWSTTAGYAWTYRESTGAATIDSKFDKSYGNGGYVWTLGNTKAEAAAGVAAALADEFISQTYTRAIFVEYALYNPGVNLVVTVALMFEVPATAGLVESASFRAVNLNRTGRPDSLTGLILEIIVFLFVVVFLLLEFQKLEKQRALYFKDGWNIITLLNLVIFLVVIVMEVTTIFQADTAFKLDQETDFQQYNLHRLVYWTTQVYNWNAFNALLTWLKTLKYVDIVNKKTTQLVATLAKASSSILVLMLLFLILYCGYGIAFFMAFGQDVEDYRSLGVSIVSLFRAMLGDFDFATLRDANRVLGPVLFITYIILIFFCLLNMFMAVIMKAYDEVVDELARTPDELSSSIRRGIRKSITRIVSSKKKRMQKIMSQRDRTLTETELQDIFDLEKDQFVRMGILSPNYLVALADTDMDGCVSLEELKALPGQGDDADEDGKQEDVPIEVVLMQMQEEQKSQRLLVTQALMKLQSAVG